MIQMRNGDMAHAVLLFKIDATHYHLKNSTLKTAEPIIKIPISRATLNQVYICEKYRQVWSTAPSEAELKSRFDYFSTMTIDWNIANDMWLINEKAFYISPFKQK